MEKERRGIGYRRYVRSKTILKKKRISNSVYGFDWYHNDGQYSKGKIRCGCGLCKYGKKYDLPTIKCMREQLRERILMKDWESDLYNLDRGVIMKPNRNDNAVTKKEDNNMEVVFDERKGYRRLDMSKLKFSDQPISMEESLKDIIPIPWSDDVLNGKKKVVISKQK